ncbi:MAG: ABC transporter permease [Acidimicrobiia bacterium]
MNRKRLLYALASPAAAALVALVISSLALIVSGYSPFTAFKAMITYLDSADSVVAIVNRAAPYYVAGLAVALGFKMGLFNIGADGQYRLAALLSAAAGAQVNFWAPLHVLFVIVVAILVGGAYAAIPGVLKVTRGVNEVVATIMLNSIATGITAYLLSVYLRDKSGRSSLVSQTKELPQSAWLPSLNRALRAVGYHLPNGTVLNGYLIVAMLAGVFFYVLVFRTRFGFELRTTGVNPSAARAAGINPGRMVISTIVLSGMIAGLIGIGPLLSDVHRYSDIFPTALGFTGITVALLGRNHPAGIAIGALVIAGIERAGQNLNTVNIPPEITKILAGVLVLSAVITYEVVLRLTQAATVREAAHRAHSQLPGNAPADEAVAAK